MLLKLVFQDESRRLHWDDSLQFNLDSLRTVIFQTFPAVTDPLTLTYVDDENDRITVLDDNDLLVALDVFQTLQMIPKIYINYWAQHAPNGNGEQLCDNLSILYQFIKSNGVDIGTFLNDCRDLSRQKVKKAAAHDLVHTFSKQLHILTTSHIVPPPNHRSSFDEAIKHVILKTNRLAVPHQGVVCDGCSADPLTGVRYKCNHCPNFDYCQICFDCLPHNSDHTFRAIVVPKNEGFFKEVIGILRTRLNRNRSQTVDFFDESEVISSVHQPLYAPDFLAQHPSVEQISLSELQDLNGERPAQEITAQENIHQLPIQEESNQVALVHEQDGESSGNIEETEQPAPIYVETFTDTTFAATWILSNPSNSVIEDATLSFTEGDMYESFSKDVKYQLNPQPIQGNEEFTLTIFLSSPSNVGSFSNTFKVIFHGERDFTMNLVLIVETAQTHQHEPRLSEQRASSEISFANIQESVLSEDENGVHDETSQTDEVFSLCQSGVYVAALDSETNSEVQVTQNVDNLPENDAQTQESLAQQETSLDDAQMDVNFSVVDSYIAAETIEVVSCDNTPTSSQLIAQANEPEIAADTVVFGRGNHSATPQMNGMIEMESLIQNDSDEQETFATVAVDEEQIRKDIRKLAVMGFTESERVEQLLRRQSYTQVLQTLLQEQMENPESMDQWTLVEDDE